MPFLSTVNTQRTNPPKKKKKKEIKTKKKTKKNTPSAPSNACCSMSFQIPRQLLCKSPLYWHYGSRTCSIPPLAVLSAPDAGILPDHVLKAKQQQKPRGERTLGRKKKQCHQPPYLTREAYWTKKNVAKGKG